VTEVPWWGIPLVAGIFTISGTITGALIARSVSITLDKARAAREEARRWDEDRRRLYAAFKAKYHEVGQFLYVHWDNSSFDHNRCTELSNELSLLAEEVVLIATDALAGVTQELAMEILSLGERKESRDDAGHDASEGRDVAFRRAIALAAEFTNFAREELGSLPTTDRRAKEGDQRLLDRDTSRISPLSMFQRR
jgi:hypothetical protein